MQTSVLVGRLRGFDPLLYGVVLATFVPAVAFAQPERPLYPRVGLNVGVAYEHVSLDPDLPRDLINHETHPDDAAFLFGSPGTTDLERIDIDAVQMQIGIAYRLGFRNLAWTVSYAPEVPVAWDGREEQQQINDPRPPAMGSFIYTKLQDVGISHVITTGLGFAFRLSEGQDWWLETQGLVSVGRWDMTFEKGWSRFGQDQPAITSQATGIDLSPKFVVSLRTSGYGFDVGVSYRRLRFHHSATNLEDHTAQGLSFSLGGRVSFRLTED
jgi:hypothetical protein